MDSVRTLDLARVEADQNTTLSQLSVGGFNISWRVQITGKQRQQESLTSCISITVHGKIKTDISKISTKFNVIVLIVKPNVKISVMIITGTMFAFVCLLSRMVDCL